ncbi:hypothetical protein [Sphaerisporangium dianthi]|uniref:Uncharacterized protein n=1 Tax=Sphaerisporangium dianthi TaxID=1436120 RepID=A0ABV9CQW0_9ACTN
MTNQPLYRVIDGEPCISTAGMALLMGVPVEELRAEQARQRAAGVPADRFQMPHAWIKQGRRIRKEVSAALGREPAMREVLDYLAARPSQDAP